MRSVIYIYLSYVSGRENMCGATRDLVSTLHYPNFTLHQRVEPKATAIQQTKCESKGNGMLLLLLIVDSVPNYLKSLHPPPQPPFPSP